MKKIILSIALALAMASCSTDPIEMRTINTQIGVNELGTKIMNVKVTPQGGNAVTIIKNGEQKLIQFNNTSLLINGVAYEVVESTPNSITYKDKEVSYVIEFNQGYIWQDNKTRTKFEIHKLGNKTDEYDVYTYNN